VLKGKGERGKWEAGSGLTTATEHSLETKKSDMLILGAFPLSICMIKRATDDATLVQTRTREIVEHLGLRNTKETRDPHTFHVARSARLQSNHFQQ